jgi:hypothetical protein
MQKVAQITASDGVPRIVKCMALLLGETLRLTKVWECGIFHAKVNYENRTGSWPGPSLGAEVLRQRYFPQRTMRRTTVGRVICLRVNVLLVSKSHAQMPPAV